jgi:hypothetical protein
VRALFPAVTAMMNAFARKRATRDLTSIEDDRHLKMIVALLVASVCVTSSPTSAQTAMGTVRTCSQAYGVCFGYCSKLYGGSERSAKCIDKCAYGRAICDRGGCFDTAAVSMCGLERR